MASRYYPTVLLRAGRETWDTVKSVIDFSDIPKTMLKCGLVVISWAFLYITGQVFVDIPGVLGQAISLIVGVLIPTFILLLIVFIAKLFSVPPPKIDKEKGDALKLIETERDKLIEQQKPKLEIIFGTLSSFKQSSPIVRDGKEVGGTQRLFRVGVCNRSSTMSIKKVTVELEQIVPDIMRDLPRPLHPMHGYDVVSLNPQKEWYWEIIYIYDNATISPYQGQFAIAHSVTGLSHFIPINNYRLTVVASGEDVSPARGDFMVVADKNGKYDFFQIEERKYEKESSTTQNL